VYQKKFPLKHLIKVLQTGLIATNGGGMKCCRLREMTYQAVENLMRATTLK
jgi:hypothetical protein